VEKTEAKDQFIALMIVGEEVKKVWIDGLDTLRELLTTIEASGGSCRLIYIFSADYSPEKVIEWINRDHPSTSNPVK